MRALFGVLVGRETMAAVDDVYKMPFEIKVFKMRSTGCVSDGET